MPATCSSPQQSYYGMKTFQKTTFEMLRLKTSARKMTMTSKQSSFICSNHISPSSSWKRHTSLGSSEQRSSCKQHTVQVYSQGNARSHFIFPKLGKSFSCHCGKKHHTIQSKLVIPANPGARCLQVANHFLQCIAYFFFRCYPDSKHSSLSFIR